ncbi:hypothetical protein [Neptuniibacter sp. QD37_11]|uniref:hypothetical protein n=1 Tax=Neptuniibacter sp. QD37_11 TaxID=3398209 RepID=UPI0039F58569
MKSKVTVYKVEFLSADMSMPVFTVHGTEVEATRDAFRSLLCEFTEGCPASFYRACQKAGIKAFQKPYDGHCRLKPAVFEEIMDAFNQHEMLAHLKSYLKWVDELNGDSDEDEPLFSYFSITPQEIWVETPISIDA